MLSRPEDWRYLAETFGGLGDAADMALGCAEVLTAESRALPLDRRAEFSQALLDNCRTVSALARELAGLLRLAEGALALAEQQIDAADLAEVAVTRCMHAAERDDITVTANLLDGIELRGDSLRLRQALENLIRHAMASGGAGALGLRMARSAGGGLAFIVSYEARPDPPGGLGLPVARQIALLHGGDVTSTPAQAHETELRLILPAPRVTWPQTAGRSSSSAA